MKFLVNQQEIIRVDCDRIVAGSQNFVEAQFDFDSAWDELVLTVCFKNGDTRRAVCNVLSGVPFFVPWEVLKAGNLYIYIEGYDGNVRVTTAKMKKPIVISKNGYFRCDETLKPPSVSVYDSLTHAYSLAQKSVDALREDAANGAFDGKDLEFAWDGTRLGVKKQGEDEFRFVDLKGEKGDDGNTALLNIINSNKNLVGTEGKVLYPVLLPKGTKLTMSTSDGSTLVSGTDYLTLHCFGIDKTEHSYWSFNPSTTPKNSRTFVLEEDTYYLSWNKTWAVPMQVEIGETVTEYEEYKGCPFLVDDGAIADVQNSLDNAEKALIKDITWIYDEYVKAGSGAFAYEKGTKRTDYLDISDYTDGLLIKGTTLTYTVYNWWYTSSKEPLSQVKDFGLGKTIIPPANAKYLVISCDANDDVYVPITGTLNEKLDKNQGTENAGKILGVGDDGNVVCVENTVNQSTIITKEIENNLNQALRGTNTGSGNSNVLSLSVFTDIHNDAENLERYLEFCNHYNSKINEKLCLGDMVSAKYSDDFTFWTNLAGSNDILCTVGNHDAWLDGTTTGGNVAKTDVYNKFFDSNIANWGVVQPPSASENGLMYYYKDYADYNVRLIVLDCMYYDDAENDWFVSVLDDAAENGLHVICASHYQPSKNLERIENCNFYSTQYDYSYVVSFDERASANVDAFISKGGYFVAWLCGDLHWDAFGVINGTNGKQLVLSFECACALNSRWYDSDRTKGTLSQDSFNFIAIDTYSSLIKVVRVGNNCDMYLKEKEHFCYDYALHKLII